MANRAKVQKTIAEAADVRRAAEEAFWASMRTELDVVRTMCILAKHERGVKRTHHLQQAEKAFESVLEIAKRFEPSEQDRRDIELARDRILQLGGRKFSELPS